MGHILEQEWTTKSGLNACVIICTRDERKTHRCGYVEVPVGHPLHSIEYNKSTPLLRHLTEKAQLGKKSPILAFTAGVNALEGDIVRCSPDVAFDVHGGLTYSGAGYFTKKEVHDGWWFGFDCAHCDDGDIEQDDRYPREGEVRALEYCVNECELLAQQIVDSNTPKSSI